MRHISRIEVTQTMKAIGAVPVFYDGNIETCKSILKACYQGGGRVFEFTNRGDFADEVFGELKKYVNQELPGMILGVGSVLDPSTAAIYMQKGTDFVVSPILNAEIAKVCNRRKVAWIPGCGSVSEISNAEELGAEVVKIFPARQVGGPSFVKAVLGPLPWSSIMPTGGVSPSEEDLTAWFQAGVHCVGIGSNLFVKNSDGNYDFVAIKEKLSHTLGLIEKIRLAK